MNHQQKKKIIVPFICAVLCAAFSPLFAAGNVTGRWYLDSDYASPGQGLTLVLELDGTDSFDPPAITVPGADITFRGGSPRNSTSITMINGRTTRTVTKSWTGQWMVKALKTGTYRIEATQIQAGGTTIALNALEWTVTEAKKDSRFILRQSISANNIISGVDVIYKIVWYIGESAQNPDFNLPIFNYPELEVTEIPAASGDTFRVPYKNTMFTGAKSSETYNGRSYTALTLTFKVKPLKSGSFDLRDTIVSFEGAVEQRQSRDIFGSLFSSPVYANLTAQAQPLVLTVEELPLKGKPSPFSGLVGNISLQWKKTEEQKDVYDIGEPIRLSLEMSGILNKPDIDTDYMVINALSSQDFAVTADPAFSAAGGVSGADGQERGYIFRARKSGRLTVPPLSLNYYNPDSRSYKTASTKALSFTVRGQEPSSAAQNRQEAAAPGVTGSGSARAGLTGSGSAGSSDTDASSGLDSSITDSPDSSLKPVSGRIPLYPLSSSVSRFPSVPWFAFAFPGTAAGIILAAAGIWRRSKTRQLRKERQQWIKLLTPLTSPEGKEALEEGRMRLAQLSQSGELWKEKLLQTGRFDTLQAELEQWNTSYFAGGHNTHSWHEKWQQICSEMEKWS